MASFSQMSGTGTAPRKVTTGDRAGDQPSTLLGWPEGSNPIGVKPSTLLPQLYASEPLVPLHPPKRLPFRPSIPAREIRRAVFKVVKEHQAKEREAALNGKNP